MVTLAPQIEGDRARVFQEQDGAARLRNAVLDEMLARHPALAPSDEVRIVVTRFRLRSTATGFWLGGFAGADILDVTVTLARGGATVRTFDTGIGSLLGGLTGATASRRFNRIAKHLAGRIVKTLSQP
jgi:hypothetical protein